MGLRWSGNTGTGTGTPKAPAIPTTGFLTTYKVTKQYLRERADAARNGIGSGGGGTKPNSNELSAEEMALVVARSQVYTSDADMYQIFFSPLVRAAEAAKKDSKDSKDSNNNQLSDEDEQAIGDALHLKDASPAKWRSKVNAFYAHIRARGSLPLKLIVTTIEATSITGATLYNRLVLQDFTGVDGRNMGVVHAGIQLGPYIIDWTTDELVLPVPIVLQSNLINRRVFAVLPLIRNFDLTEANCRAVCKVLVDYNRNKSYGLGQFKAEPGKRCAVNCHALTWSLLEVLLTPTEKEKHWLFSPSAQTEGNALRDFFDLIRKDAAKACRMPYSSHGDVLEFNPPVTPPSGLKTGDEKTAVWQNENRKNHVRLDRYVFGLLETKQMSGIETDYNYQLLKSFDRAFWLRNYMQTCCVNRPADATKTASAASASGGSGGMLSAVGGNSKQSLCSAQMCLCCPFRSVDLSIGTAAGFVEEPNGTEDKIKPGPPIYFDGAAVKPITPISAAGTAADAVPLAAFGGVLTADTHKSDNKL